MYNDSTARSSNGRTTVSGTVYLGSNPSLATYNQKNMQEKNENKISVDVLKHLESLSININKLMASRTSRVFRHYPVTFGLLILIGAMALHEGLKGLMKKFGLLEIDPLYLLFTGIIILSITGTLYKKLDK
jgi:hypothetical protein